MRVLGEKWAVLAIREITFGSRHFDEIVSNTGAPRDILTSRLRSLEEAGLIERRAYSDHPVRYEYELTSAGQNLFGALHMIRDWGDQHLRTDPEHVTRFLHEGDHEFRPVMTCASCGEVVEFGSVHPETDLHRSDLAS